MIPRCLERDPTVADIPEGEFGYLGVYRFDPQTTISTASAPVASFALPVLN